MTEAAIIQKSVLDWILYDKGLRHERVKKFLILSMQKC